jgi:hypothetical protein
MSPFVPARRSRRQSAPVSPLALVRVPYRHGDLLVVEGDYPEHGERPVPLRPYCERLGIALAPQLTRLRGKSWTSVTMIVTKVPGDAQAREMACIPLRSLPMWLALINPRKVTPGAREVLEAYQREAAEVLRRHFLPGLSPPPSAPPEPPAAPQPARELPPAPTQTSPRPSAALLRARDMEAIEDELLFLKTQAGRLEAHAGLREPVRHAIGELFERVERLERRLGLALVAPAWRPGGDAGRTDVPEEHPEGEVDPELGALRVAVRQMRDQVEGMKGCIGVAPGDELPDPVEVAPRETALTTPARVRAFLLECTEALEPAGRASRARKPRGMTATELAIAYDGWAEPRGIPPLGAHALAQQLARMDTPRMQYRRRFYFAVRLRVVVPTS